METYFSTGQSPQRAVAPTEEEEDILRAGRVAVRSGHDVSKKKSLDADGIFALSTRYTVCLSI
jgi:hypothetical protein